MPSNIVCKDSCTSQLNSTAGRGWVVLQYGGEWEDGCGEWRGRGWGWGWGWGGAYYAPVAIRDHSAKGTMVRVSVIASQGGCSHWVWAGGGGGGGGEGGGG